MSLRIGSLVIGGGGDTSSKANLTDPIFPNTVTATGGFIGNLTGNASTATKAKNIPTTDEGGNIWIDGTVINTNEITNVVTADTAGQCTGNSATATKWATARTLALVGAVTGSASIDGSGNVNLTTTYSDIEASSFANNGYIKFKNGFIVQWGELTSSANTTVTVTFPIPFTTACLKVFTQQQQSTLQADYNANVIVQAGYTKTSVTIMGQLSNTAWFAIGY